MKWLICDEKALSRLAEINNLYTDRQIVPVPDADGVMLVSDEPIGDEYWSDYTEWLLSLPESTTTPIGI